MNRILVSLAATSAACLLAPAAQAAQVLTISGPSGTVTNDDVTCASGATTPCSFTNTFTFTTPSGFNLASADISSTMTSALTDINFSSVTLNSIAFTSLSSGVSEFRNLLNQALVVGGTNTLTITGTTGGNAAYSGNLSFAAAVPEPATWAMMLVGFGLIGAAVRYRRRNSLVAFA